MRSHPGRSIKPVRILLALLCWLPAWALADGFGWYGQAFRHEAIREMFGGAGAKPARVSAIQAAMAKHFAEQFDREAIPAITDALSSMLKNGWRSTHNKPQNQLKWEIFDLISENPSIVPELRFGEMSGIIDPELLLEALTLSPAKPSMLRHFQKFGRELGAAEGHRRCADIVPGLAVGYEPSLGECGPYYMIFSPAEVTALDQELQAIRPRMDAEKLSRLRSLLDLVASARSTKSGIFFQAFN